jgi:hypothetical protein
MLHDLAGKQGAQISLRQLGKMRKQLGFFGTEPLGLTVGDHGLVEINSVRTNPSISQNFQKLSPPTPRVQNRSRTTTKKFQIGRLLVPNCLFFTTSMLLPIPEIKASTTDHNTKFLKILSVRGGAFLNRGGIGHRQPWLW